MPLVALFKFCRVRIPCSSDDPPVESLAPFEADAAVLPGDIQAQFASSAQELAKLGWSAPDKLRTHLFPIFFTELNDGTGVAGAESSKPG